MARRQRLLRARTRAKNEVHAALARNLCPRPPARDLFGRRGRRWLDGVELPEDERLSVAGCLRQIDCLDGEDAALDRVLAERALRSPAIRLMTVPGVNVNTAAAMASVGDIRRFDSPRKLVGYLSLDPRVRQSGSSQARHGHISKAGSSEARHMLGEAAWSVTMTAGPMRAFFERIRARRGPQVAATATARKLCALFWHLLTREEDYAFARDALTRQKLRQLELRAGAKSQRGRQPRMVRFAGATCTSENASSPPRRNSPIDAWSPTGSSWERRVPARHRGARLVGRLSGQRRGRAKPHPAL